MNKIVEIFIFTFFILSFLFSSESNSQQEMMPCGRNWNSSLAAVEGRIDRVYFAVPPGGYKEGLHFDVKTKQGDIVTAHIFPKNCVKMNPDKFNFREGDSITVLGSSFLTEGGNRQNICTSIIFRYSDSLELRDPDTGKMDYSLCNNCSRICENACKGKPIMCVQMCMSRCGSSF